LKVNGVLVNVQEETRVYCKRLQYTAVGKKCQNV